jgi:hypothetical protein
MTGHIGRREFITLLGGAAGGRSRCARSRWGCRWSGILALRRRILRRFDAVWWNSCSRLKHCAMVPGH